MNPAVKNLFADLSGSGDREEFTTVLQTDHVRMERIVSYGQRSPEDFWYDQPEDEWVVLLRGTASLQFPDGATVKLKAGDYLPIDRRVKHRVGETSADAVWLAVHCG
jgi:cupin 2 domain-containing protein